MSRHSKVSVNGKSPKHYYLFAPKKSRLRQLQKIGEYRCLVMLVCVVVEKYGKECLLKIYQIDGQTHNHNTELSNLRALCSNCHSHFTARFSSCSTSPLITAELMKKGPPLEALANVNIFKNDAQVFEVATIRVRLVAQGFLARKSTGGR